MNKIACMNKPANHNAKPGRFPRILDRIARNPGCFVGVTIDCHGLPEEVTGIVTPERKVPQKGRDVVQRCDDPFPVAFWLTRVTITYGGETRPLVGDDDFYPIRPQSPLVRRIRILSNG